MVTTSAPGRASLSFVVAAMLATSSQPLLAQDRTARPAETADQSASQSGLLVEPSFMAKAIDRADRELNQGGDPKDGFFPELGNMLTGSGWISGGPGYRHHLFEGQAVVNVSAAVSWNVYKMAQGRFELPHLAKDHLTLGSQVIYQDLLQVNYFGLGNESLESNRSGYRLDETDVPSGHRTQCRGLAIHLQGQRPIETFDAVWRSHGSHSVRALTSSRMP
jgi:hypothetical protein